MLKFVIRTDLLGSRLNKGVLYFQESFDLLIRTIYVLRRLLFKIKTRKLYMKLSNSLNVTIVQNIKL